MSTFSRFWHAVCAASIMTLVVAALIGLSALLAKLPDAVGLSIAVALGFVFMVPVFMRSMKD